MQILITGGLGVMGSSIASILLSQGHQITILDSSLEERHWLTQRSLGSHPQVKQLTIYIGYLEEAKLDQLEQFDLILHLAANTGIPGSVSCPQYDFDSNILATHKLLEKLRTLEKKIPTIITSSVKPYRVNHLATEEQKTRYAWKNKWLAGINEDFPLVGRTPYSYSKATQSLMAQSYAWSYNLPIVIFRCSNLYGPALPKAGHGWLTSFCLAAQKRSPITIQGNGKVVRDMLYADDLCNAMLVAAERIDQTAGQIFNIGGGQNNSISVLEATQFLQEQYPSLQVNYDEGRVDEDPIFITDYSKLQKTTDWKPKVSVQEGMKRILEWAKPRI